MSELVLERVSKSYRGGRAAVRDLSLTVPTSELLVLLGASGSGKTTTLRLIAGLEAPGHGTIRIGGRDVTRLPPHARQVVLSFQSPALYPQLTVAENLVFHERLKYNFLRRGRLHLSGELRERQDEVCALLGIDALLERRPAELSGGERQRVALGRALIRQPAVFLLDEPLAHVDQPERRRIRQAVRELQRRRGATMLWVTHDPAEAFAIGDRLAVLHQGELLQVDQPEELIRKPVDGVVAELLAECQVGQPK
jgi:ABC-type sugar transport system ATPase subunit